MKKSTGGFKKITTVLVLVLSLVLICGIFVACGGTAPIAVEGQSTTISIDRKSTKSRNFSFETYINENGATGVEYAAESSDVSVATVKTDELKMTVTFVDVGNAKITLTASVGGAVKVSIEFNFTVIDTTPKNFTVTGIADGTGYVMSGGNSATDSAAYKFSVTVDDLYVAASGVSVKYQAAGSSEKTANGVKDAAFSKEKYDFTIPATDITGNLEIKAPAGITKNTADAATVAGISDGSDYAMVGSTAAFINKDYTFVVDAPSYYNGVTAKYKVNSGATKSLTGVAEAASEGISVSYLFTIPKADLAKDAVVTISDVALTMKAANFDDKFYTTAAWESLNGLTDGVVPTIETDTSMKFQSTFIRVQNLVPNNFGNVGGDYMQLSFMVKTAGDFDFAIFATNSVRKNAAGTSFGYSTDNYLKLFSEGGVVGVTSAQSNGAVGVVPAGMYNQGEWNRIDLCINKVAGDGSTAAASDVIVKVFVNGVKAVLTEGTGVSTNSSLDAKGNLVCGTELPNYGNRLCVYAGAEAVYVKKVA